VRLRVKLPAGARLSTKLAPITVKDDRRIVTVNDRLEGGALVFERLVDMPAGRVQPDAYPSFQQFARSSDSALDRDVVVHLGGGT
jgi:cellulose synthase operon protein C